MIVEIAINLLLLVAIVLVVAAIIALSVWRIFHSSREARTGRAALRKVPLGVLLFDRAGRRTFTTSLPAPRCNTWTAVRWIKCGAVLPAACSEHP